MPRFASLTPRPADALLGLMAAYRADPRPDKVDLGVGVYKDPEGQTPIMGAVQAAERRLAQSATTKVYEGPQGNTAFTKAIDGFLFEDGARSDRRIGFSTPGGCGALFLGMSLIGRTRADATLWMSDPTWPNHPQVAKSLGLKVGSYAYAAPADPGVDLEAMLASLDGARPGDGLLLQGPCHNPTGIDLSDEQWDRLATFCIERELLPLIDVAYHGFAKGLREDLLGIRRFLARVPDALVAYSCSKNFGLYRERCGALIALAETEDQAETVRTHLADIARTSYSMPPAHGQAIVATILGDEELTRQWQEELAAMQSRMASLRASLAAALRPSSNSYDPQVLTAQNGMFSQLPFVEGGVAALKEAGIYLPGSGRINIAGLTSEDIPRVAELFSAQL